jgi:N-acetylmuramoyl-L-alanine amidase
VATGTAAPPATVIVLDPGHGGDETGALGPSGAREKDLVLMIAHSLERRLEERLGVRVILTREEDQNLGLDARSAIANQHQAALFISLHLNAAWGGRAKATGAETYFLSLAASDARAAESAALENRSDDGSVDISADPDVDDDLRMILWDLAQTHHLGESQRFARIVQEELDTTLGLRDRGVKQAPFRVLMGAAMPAVLVELGFISNPEEEARLLDPEYRSRLVDALVRAVQRFQGGGPREPGTP